MSLVLPKDEWFGGMVEVQFMGSGASLDFWGNYISHVRVNGVEKQAIFKDHQIHLPDLHHNALNIVTLYFCTKYNKDTTGLYMYKDKKSGEKFLNS